MDGQYHAKSTNVGTGFTCAACQPRPLGGVVGGAEGEMGDGGRPHVGHHLIRVHGGDVIWNLEHNRRVPCAV